MRRAGGEDTVAGRGREQLADAGVGGDPAAADHHQVVSDVFQFAHQVTGHQDDPSLSGQRVSSLCSVQGAAIAMAIGSRPTFMGFPAELVATRIGMTWPRPKGGLLTSALNSILDSIVTCAPNGISGP